jgi:O-antigen/teichoic acid export membrane protein
MAGDETTVAAAPALPGAVDATRPAGPPATVRDSLVGLGRRALTDPSAGLLAAQLVVAGVAFLANVLAARALAPSGRGELALLLQIGYLASLGLLLGTDRSVVAVFTGSSAGVTARAFARLLAWPTVAALAGLLVAAAITGTAASGVLGDWWVVGGLCTAFAVTNAFVRATRSIAISAHRHRDYVVCTVVSQGLLLAAQVVLLAAGVRTVAVWLSVYLLCGAIPTAAVLVAWSRREPAQTRTSDGDRHGDGDDAPLRAARREGLALFPAAVANSGMLRLDRLLLAGLVSTASLGVYASVATITEALAWPLLSFADARLGRWRAAHDDDAFAVRRLVRGLVVYAVVVVPVVAVPLYLLVVPLLGEAYRSAQHLVVPLVVAAIVFAAEQILASVLIAKRRNASASVAEVTGFAVSVLAYLWLIPGHGALGAAYGSLIGYSAGLLAAVAALVLPPSQRGRA